MASPTPKASNPKGRKTSPKKSPLPNMRPPMTSPPPGAKVIKQPDIGSKTNGVLPLGVDGVNEISAMEGEAFTGGSNITNQAPFPSLVNQCHPVKLDTDRSFQNKKV